MFFTIFAGLENTGQIKVLLALKNFLALQGFRMVVLDDPQMSEAGVATSREELFDIADQTAADLVVIDMEFDDLMNEEVLTAYKSFFYAHKVLMISALHKEAIYKVHKEGISGFITIDSDAREIKDAMYATAHGGKFFSPKIVEVLIEQSIRHVPEIKEELHRNLSGREMEILLLVAAGKSTKEIADQINLSPHTVYTHRKNILKKLACKSASELINYAYSQGLIEK